MSLNINVSGSYSTTTTAAPSNPTQELATAALQVAESATQLAQSLVQQLQGCATDSFQPAPSQPVDSFKAAYDSMDPGKAAQTVLSHFDAIEGVGVNDSGAGAGDSNIGRRELERVADPNSGFPPEARAAAKWLIDHPISARSVDQGAGKARGDANEVHLSKEDLKAFASQFPSTATPVATPVASPPAATPSSPPAATPSNPRCGTGASGFEPPVRAPVDLCGTVPPRPSGQKELDVYSAAKVVKDHFQFVEGVGMNDTGAGAGDCNIGLSELQRVADPNSGAPAEVREAVKFLLDHRTALRSVDQGASKARGDAQEVHISLKDLEAFTANAPASSRFSGSLGVAQLAREMTLRG